MNNLHPVSLVVFDCDGVLLESVEVKTRAFGETVVEHGPAAVSRLLEYHAANGGVSRYKKFEWLYSEVLGRKITKPELHTLADRFKKLAFEGVMNAPMVPGSMQCIEALYGKTPMYVASGAPHEELIAVLEARGLSLYFEGMYGSPPDKKSLLQKIIKANGANPAETLMVGDSSTDLGAALSCGTKFFGRGLDFRSFGWPCSNDLTILSKMLQNIT